MRKHSVNNVGYALQNNNLDHFYFYFKIKVIMRERVRKPYVTSCEVDVESHKSKIYHIRKHEMLMTAEK